MSLAPPAPSTPFRGPACRPECAGSLLGGRGRSLGRGGLRQHDAGAAVALDGGARGGGEGVRLDGQALGGESIAAANHLLELESARRKSSREAPGVRRVMNPWKGAAHLRVCMRMYMRLDALAPRPSEAEHPRGRRRRRAAAALRHGGAAEPGAAGQGNAISTAGSAETREGARPRWSSEELGGCTYLLLLTTRFSCSDS
jgi:hypothetical protein